MDENLAVARASAFTGTGTVQDDIDDFVLFFVADDDVQHPFRHFFIENRTDLDTALPAPAGNTPFTESIITAVFQGFYNAMRPFGTDDCTNKLHKTASFPANKRALLPGEWEATPLSPQ